MKAIDNTAVCLPQEAPHQLKLVRAPQKTRKGPQKLTEKAVAALPVTGREYTVRDAQVTGLLVAVRKASKTYAVQRDLRSGGRVQTIRISLGSTSELSLDLARSKAMSLLALIRQGIDPREKPKAEPAAALTVAQAFEAYAQRCRAEERAARTIADLDRYLGYLDGWRSIPLASVTKAMARQQHADICQSVGASSANKALRAFRAVWNHVAKTRDEQLGVNPVVGVTFRKERAKNRSIEADDLATWFATVQKLPNALRRMMHELGLFSGLRPGNLVSLQKAWVKLDQRAIVIPAEHMKARREFSLPLSDHLLGLVQRILTLSEMVEAGSPWLFPTRAANGDVTHAQCWREKTLPSETGHILRHTYSNMASLAGVNGDDRQLLLAQSVAGVRGTYLHVPALWTRLLAQQSVVSAFLLGKVQP